MTATRFPLSAALVLLPLSGCMSVESALTIESAAAPAFAPGVSAPSLPEALELSPEPAARTISEPETAHVASAAYAGPAPSDPVVMAALTPPAAPDPTPPEVRGTELDRLIARYAAHYEVPEALVRRVVRRESNFRPHARNGPYWGLMQILPQTARTMGHSGPPQELLDAETNLKYAVKYLRGAYLVADGNHDRAVRLYASGYYYHARDRGMLEATGLGRDRKRRRAR